MEKKAVTTNQCQRVRWWRRCWQWKCLHGVCWWRARKLLHRVNRRKNSIIVNSSHHICNDKLHKFVNKVSSQSAASAKMPWIVKKRLLPDHFYVQNNYHYHQNYAFKKVRITVRQHQEINNVLHFTSLHWMPLWSQLKSSMLIFSSRQAQPNHKIL